MDPTGNILLSGVRGMSRHLSENKTVLFQAHEHQSKIFWAVSVNWNNIKYPWIYSGLLYGFFLLLRDLSAAFTITFSVVTKTTKQHTTFRKQNASYKLMNILLIFFVYNLCQKAVCRYQIFVPSTSRSPKWSLPTTMIYAYIPHTILFTPPFYLYIRPKIWINVYCLCN